jgi:hypothetical protein
MPLSTGRSKLFNGLKTLRAQWQRVQDVWDDAVAREFEENVFKLLDDETQSTIRATDRMDQVLSQMFRECE